MIAGVKYLTRDRLDRLCRLVTDGTHDSPRLQPSGIPFIKGKHISGGYVDFENCDYIAKKDHEKAIQRSKPERSDILFSNIGSVGDAAFIDTNKEFSIKNVALFKPDPGVVDNRYLYYVVTGPKFRGELFAKRSGVAQPFLSLEMLRGHEVEYHLDIAIQRKIASILSAYDDLIENNLRRINILEEMAQNLYREWFVKFRFPGHEKARFKNSPLGRIPEGWEVTTVKQIIRRLPKGIVRKQADVQTVGATPVIDQSRDEVLGFHDSEPDFDASPTSPIAIFGDHTCKMQLLVEPFSIGPNVVPFVADGECQLGYVYFVIGGLIETREYKRHWNDLISKEVAVATDDLTDQFSGIVAPVLDYERLFKRRNLVLRRTRDLLLPRLISGELDVSNLDIRISDV